MGNGYSNEPIVMQMLVTFASLLVVLTLLPSCYMRVCKDIADTRNIVTGTSETKTSFAYL